MNEAYPFYRCGSAGSGKLHNLPGVIQSLRCGAGFEANGSFSGHIKLTVSLWQLSNSRNEREHIEHM